MPDIVDNKSSLEPSEKVTIANLPSLDSIPLSNDLVAKEASTLADIKKDGKGGLGIDETISALQFLLKDWQRVFIVNSYSNQNKSIINELEFLDDKIELVMIPYALTPSHCILIAINKKLAQIQIYDSLNVNPSVDDIKLIKLLGAPYNQYSVVPCHGDYHYGQQKNDWECTVHVISTALNLAFATKLSADIDLDTNLQYFWRAAKAQEQINATQLAYFETNRQQKLKISDAIEKMRMTKGFEFLNPLADALQIELWGNTEREKLHRLPNSNDEYLYRSFRQFLNEFTKLKTANANNKNHSTGVYLAERLANISFPTEDYDTIVEEKMRQICQEILEIPDEARWAKLIEYFNADIAWSHEEEELDDLLRTVKIDDVNGIAKHVIPENEFSQEKTLIGMYKRLLQEHLDERNYQHQDQVLDDLQNKKIETVNKRMPKIKDSLNIDDEFAEFLAKEPCGMYQRIQVEINEKDLVKDYSREELNEIVAVTLKSLNKDIKADNSLFFDKNKLNEATFICARVTSPLLFETLFSRGADINAQRPEDGCTLLHEAILHENHESVEILLQRDSSGIDCVNHDNESALHLAIKRNARDLVKLLLSYSANANLLCDDRAPLRLAFEHTNSDIFELLLSYPNIDLAVNSKNILFGLRWDNSPNLLQMLLETNIDINIQDDDGDTPLHLFIRKSINDSEYFTKAMPLIKIMLNHPKIDINLQNKKGQALLQKFAHEVAWSKPQEEFIELLDLILQKKPDLNLKADNHKTALQILLRSYSPKKLYKNHAIMIDRLVRAGAEMMSFESPRCPVFSAAIIDEAKLNSNVPLLTALISKGHFTKAHFDGLTLEESIKILVYASNPQQESVLNSLTECGRDKNNLFKRSIKELNQNCINEVNQLLKLGANPNQAIDGDSKHLLVHRVLEITNDELRNELLTLLLQNKLDVQVRPSSGANLLEYFLSLKTTTPSNDEQHRAILTTINLLTQAGLDLDAQPVVVNSSSQFFSSSSNNQEMLQSARQIAETKGFDLCQFEIYKLGATQLVSGRSD